MTDDPLFLGSKCDSLDADQVSDLGSGLWIVFLLGAGAGLIGAAVVVWGLA